MKNLIIFFSCFVLFISACRKDETFDNNPNLRLQFSTDSILFDTVFTNTGSTNRVLKIFNFNKNSIVLSEISLGGGEASSFKVNINGQATSSLNNIKIKGNDSIYVFIKAFINPNDSNSPFFVEDSLRFSLNGNNQTIPIVAYGQNAVYLNNEVINTNTTFTKEKPYVIYNYVLVDEQTTLNIDAGARLYFHKDSKLFISGTLKANGSLADSITIASDRKERLYDNEAGQWQGIHLLRSSLNNTINYTTIKNSLIGIRVDSLSNNNNPKLLLTNSIIKNHEVAGVLGYTASIVGLNNLFYNCGQFLMIGLYGGDYQFYQNTFANFNYNFPRKTPSVFLSDNLNDKSNKMSNDLKSIFTNNIIYGSLSKELDFDKIGNKFYQNTFENNLIKTDQKDLGPDNIYNQDPFFIDPRKENYKVVSNSPAGESGKNLTTNIYYNLFLFKDLEGNNRIFPSTLGCFER